MHIERNETAMKITEVAFAKNEGRFLLEWLAYHRVIGVTDFVIYTNDCEDGSPALLDRLQELGIVRHIPNPILPGEAPQSKALTAAAMHPDVKTADYILQTDIDEFLCVKAGNGTIEDLISIAPDADAICIQMRFFGDSHHDRLPEGLVMEHFVRSSEEQFRLNNVVKTLVRNNDAFTRVTANHTPGFVHRSGRPRFFNCGGEEIPPETYGATRFRTVSDDYRSMRYAQLNHYAVKSLDCYHAKRYRGDAADNPDRLNLAYWHERNRNECEDRSLCVHLPATKIVMQKWLEDSELRRLNDACRSAFRAICEKAGTIFNS